MKRTSYDEFLDTQLWRRDREQERAEAEATAEQDAEEQAAEHEEMREQKFTCQFCGEGIRSGNVCKGCERSM